MNQQQVIAILKSQQGASKRGNFYVRYEKRQGEWVFMAGANPRGEKQSGVVGFTSLQLAQQAIYNTTEKLYHG